MIVFALAVIMFVNKGVKIPADNLFTAAIVILLLLSITDFSIERLKNVICNKSAEDLSIYRKMLLFSSVVNYVLRPCIILLELFLLNSDLKHKIICILPALVNAVIYCSAFFTSTLAFEYDINGIFQRGTLGMSVYYVQLVYVFMLLYFSIKCFKKNNSRKSIIIFAIIFITVIIAYLESTAILTGMVNQVTALCVLMYYIYLATIYQQEIRESLAEKELKIAQDNLIILKNQIQPHFVYNSLSVIRSLIKRDNVKAVECIDNFSEYLKAHIRAIKFDMMIPFENELKNINAYLSLVQADYTRKVHIIYDLRVTDFRIPPLSLEPIIENAVKHGIGKEEGYIKIETYSANDSIIILITDNGSGQDSHTKNESEHLGIGLENTQKRLALQCSGTLEIKTKKTGTTVKIAIPYQGAADKNEYTDCR